MWSCVRVYIFYAEDCNVGLSQACVITKEQKLGGSVETEKDCIDPKSKYCRESRYCSGLFYETCRECCYDTMCNAAYPPAAGRCLQIIINPYRTDHNYCHFSSALLAEQMTVIGNEMCV